VLKGVPFKTLKANFYEILKLKNTLQSSKNYINILKVITKMEDKAKNNRVVSFRLDINDFELLMKKIQESGVNKSEFLRDVVLKNKTIVVRKEDSVKLIYHINKMGNNLNQIAHKINSAYLEEIISEKLFEEYLNNLNTIKNQHKNLIQILLHNNKKEK
jgi:alpha-N-acetylglucosamine transferase